MNKKALLFAMLLIAAVVLMSGCGLTDKKADANATPRPAMTAQMYTDYDSLYTHYNDLAFEDTLATITEKYGEPTGTVTSIDDNEVTYTNYEWVFEDGTGFVCAFFDSGSLRAKVVYYEDLRQFRDLSAAGNLSVVENFDTSTSFQDIMGYFTGRPIEIARMIESETTKTAVYRVYAWIDKDDNIVQILFKDDGKVSSVSYNLD